MPSRKKAAAAQPSRGGRSRSKAAAPPSPARGGLFGMLGWAGVRLWMRGTTNSNRGGEGTRGPDGRTDAGVSLIGWSPCARLSARAAVCLCGELAVSLTWAVAYVTKSPPFATVTGTCSQGRRVGGRESSYRQTVHGQPLPTINFVHGAQRTRRTHADDQ